MVKDSSKSEAVRPPAEAAALPQRAGFSYRAGLEAKIVLMVAALLSAALACTCWLWASRTDTQIINILGEQTRQTAVTLSMAAREKFRPLDPRGLREIGQSLLKARNVLFVAFYDASGRNLVLADRTFSAEMAPLVLQATDISALARVQQGDSPRFGSYLQVCQPVLSNGMDTSPSQLVGYVAVGISPREEQRQVERVNFFAMGIGCVMILLIVPMAYVLVHRIFRPIRQLVTATQRISAGQWDAAVAIDRTDAIGELARSFNAMLSTIKLQQEDLRQANTDLESKVAQRTSQLEAANRRLSSEIAEKEDFLRAVSHDLNAPLRNISGMTTMLLAKHAQKFDEDVIHRLQRIQKNVEAETDLISELLELSRIKTRREKMELVDTAALVRELEGILENDLRTRNISLILDNPLPIVHGERSRFRQIFQNLIDNAIKYMGDGPVREIHVGCTLHPTEAEFYVRDTGVGIEKEDIAKVFYIFRRGKYSTSNNIPGKGVGLSCVKSIVETYSGSIRVTSDPGKGSTFLFTINGQFVPDAARMMKAGVAA